MRVLLRVAPYAPRGFAMNVWLAGYERIDAAAKAWGPPRKLSSIRRIVVHRLHRGSGAAGIRYAQSLPDGRTVSWHFTVCADGRVAQHLPLDVVGWHGGPKNNRDSIGIEHASGPLGMDEPWSTECVEASIALCQQLCGAVGRQLELVRHSDLTASRRDPGSLWPAACYEAAGLVVRGG